MEPLAAAAMIGVQMLLAFRAFLSSSVMETKVWRWWFSWALAVGLLEGKKSRCFDGRSMVCKGVGFGGR